MTIGKLAQIVAEMRHAPRDYFRTKSQSALAKAKRLEEDVDRHCDRLLNETQSTLFADE